MWYGVTLINVVVLTLVFAIITPLDCVWCRILCAACVQIIHHYILLLLPLPLELFPASNTSCTSPCNGQWTLEAHLGCTLGCTWSGPDAKIQTSLGWKSKILLLSLIFLLCVLKNKIIKGVVLRSIISQKLKSLKVKTWTNHRKAEQTSWFCFL